MLARIRAVESAHSEHKEAFDKHVDRTEHAIEKINARADNIKEVISDLKSTMATRNDVAALSAAVAQGFDRLSQRMDGRVDVVHGVHPK